MNNIEIARRLEYVARFLSKPGVHLQSPTGRAIQYSGMVKMYCLHAAIYNAPDSNYRPECAPAYDVVDQYWKKKGYISAIAANDGQGIRDGAGVAEKAAATHEQIIASLKTCARRLRKQEKDTAYGSAHLISGD